MKIEPRYIAETASTNSWMTAHDDGVSDMAVWTDYQTAGRGCGINTWESQRGMNLLFSILIHPAGVPATSQFILSMANALALRCPRRLCRRHHDKMAQRHLLARQEDGRHAD